MHSQFFRNFSIRQHGLSVKLLLKFTKITKNCNNASIFSCAISSFSHQYNIMDNSNSLNNDWNNAHNSFNLSTSDFSLSNVKKKYLTELSNFWTLICSYERNKYMTMMFHRSYLPYLVSTGTQISRNICRNISYRHKCKTQFTITILVDWNQSIGLNLNMIKLNIYIFGSLDFGWMLLLCNVNGRFLSYTLDSQVVLVNQGCIRSSNVPMFCANTV